MTKSTHDPAGATIATDPLHHPRPRARPTPPLHPAPPARRPMQMTDDPYTLERWQDDIATIATALRPGERLQIAIGRQPPIITNADGYVCTVDERLRQLQATPTCPCCHGKFTKPRGTTTCNRCGLPDDVITAGPNAIARYTKTYHRTTAAAARVRSSTPRRSKHGRQRPTRRRT